MKNVLALVALSLALSLSACTKKEAAPEGATEEKVEGTTSAPPAENAPPAEEMQEKKEEAPAPAAH